MSFLDFLFPKKCLGCGQTGRYFCKKCVAKIKLIDRPICPVCARPSPFGQTHPLCQTRYALDGLPSVFAYSGIIRRAIKQLKYRFRFDLTEELVTILLNNLSFELVENILVAPDQVIPIPLHRWRQDWRGFNQAGLLAKTLAGKLELPFYEDLLVRKHYTQPQTELKKEDREKNVKNAFAINSRYKTNKSGKINKSISVNLQAAQEEIESVIKVRAPLNQRKSKSFGNILPTSVLLFDDVWTTGATMKICANLLKRAGFKKVWGLTVAR